MVLAGPHWEVEDDGSSALYAVIMNDEAEISPNAIHVRGNPGGERFAKVIQDAGAFRWQALQPPDDQVLMEGSAPSDPAARLAAMHALEQRYGFINLIDTVAKREAKAAPKR